MSDRPEPRGKVWIAYAVGALVLYAVSNFLSGAIGQEADVPSHAGLSNFQVQALTDGAFGLVALGVLFAQGKGLRDAKSRRWVLVQTSCGMALAVGNISLTYGIATNYLYKAFVSAVLPVNAVFLAAVCWLVLGEPLTLLQGAGIAVSLAGLVCMAAADGNADGLQGLLFGLATAVCYAIGNFGIKFCSMRGMGHLTGVCLLWLGMGVVGVIMFVALSFARGNFFDGLGTLRGGEDAGGRLVLFALTSGLTQAGAVGFMKLALVLGAAAPAMAIANANAVGVLALDLIFFNPELNAVKVIGLVLTIAGVTALALAPPAKKAEPLIAIAQPAGAGDLAAPLDQTSLQGAGGQGS